MCVSLYLSIFPYLAVVLPLTLLQLVLGLLALHLQPPVEQLELLAALLALLKLRLQLGLQLAGTLLQNSKTC